MNPPSHTQTKTLLCNSVDSGEPHAPRCPQRTLNLSFQHTSHVQLRGTNIQLLLFN